MSRFALMKTFIALETEKRWRFIGAHRQAVVLPWPPHTHFPSLKYVFRVSLKLLEYFTNSFFWCSRALIKNKEIKQEKSPENQHTFLEAKEESLRVLLLTLRFWYWYFLMTLLTVSRSSLMALAMSLQDNKDEWMTHPQPGLWAQRSAEAALGCCFYSEVRPVCSVPLTW